MTPAVFREVNEGMAEVQSTFSLRRGDAAPGFQLPDPAGKLHELHQLRGNSGELRLYYAGQFDSTRPKSGAVPSGDDLRAAVKSMLAGEEPAARSYPSSGCNIKWKTGSEPPYFH